MDTEQSVAHVAGENNVRCFEVAATEPLPEAAAAVMEEFDQLTGDFQPHQIEIIRLRMQGFEMTEIAQQVGRSERTVRRLLEKVRQRWNERLDALTT